MLLHEVLRNASRAAHRDTALIFDGRVVSFGELWALVGRAADVIRSTDPDGSDLAVVSENSVEMVVALYAASLLGRRAVLGNTRLAMAELDEMLHDVEPTVVLVSATQRERFAAAASVSPAGAWTLLDLDALDASDVVGDRGTGGGEQSDLDTVWVIHTSGTTGRAKPVEVTHRSLISAVLNTALSRPIADDAVYLMPFPLFHVAAYNIVHCHLRRRPVVLVSKFEPDVVMGEIESHRVSMLSLAPTMLTMMLEHPSRDSFDLSSIETIAYGAAAMSPDLLRRGADELGCGFAEGYGMTELSGNAVFLGPAEHAAALRDSPHLLTSAGKPGPLVAVAIIDQEGRELAVGEVGEIAVRGDQVMGGYLDRPEAMAASFTPDGWFLTGDVGRIDGEGYLYVVDRSKDIIITGGENVSSREVEDVVSTHRHVASAAVVGLPDERWGEMIVAVVVPADPGVAAAEIIDHCRKHLSGFKCPKRVEFIDGLPTNASGKVLKAELRRLMTRR